MQKLEEEVSGNHTVSHTPKDTHTMFSSSSPLRAFDGLLNGQAMTLPFSALTFYASWSAMCLAP